MVRLPATKVHHSSIPWNDASGERLRGWMGVTPELFYDPEHFAVLPVGLCYPGRTRGGDAPPRKECAPLWFDRIHAQMPHVELTLLIGRYAQQHYLKLPKSKKLRDTVLRGADFMPRYLPLVHPSPRNRRWLRNNPWFEEETVTLLRQRLREIYPNLPATAPLELPEKLFSL